MKFLNTPFAWHALDKLDRFQADFLGAVVPKYTEFVKSTITIKISIIYM